MPQPRVTITSRADSGIKGFMRVFATVIDGDSGEYTIASAIIGTDAEIREILEQSAHRMDTRDATAAGRE